MLFSQAVCGSCGAAFASGVVVAERRGDPVSYRGTAGPCPRCGGRGRIPGWIFRFHGAAAAARDQASAADNAAVLHAARQRVAHYSDESAQRGLTTTLGGAWGGVAVQLRWIPADECEAALAMLVRMLEDGEAHESAGPADNRRSGATTSAGPGTPDATPTPMSA